MKRILSFFLAALAAILTLSSCESAKKVSNRDYFFFDTYVSIKITGNDFDHDSVQNGARELLEEIDTELSRDNENGDLYRFNKSESGIECTGSHLLLCLERAIDLSASLGGKCSPTLGALTSLYDFEDGEKAALPSEAEINEALSHIDIGNVKIDGKKILKTDPALLLDLGAFGKGYAAEKLTEYLKKCGVKDAVFSLGGNIGVITPGESDIKTIAVRSPDGDGYCATVKAPCGYLSVSGDYERFFEADGKRYGHIIDPVSGTPCVSDIHSVAVWSEDGVFADAMSTALFVTAGDDSYFDGNLPEYATVISGENGTKKDSSKTDKITID